MGVELCKVCGRLKPSLAVEQGDDFCSTKCARGRYGSPPTRRGAWSHRNAARIIPQGFLEATLGPSKRPETVVAPASLETHAQ